ncbi:MAG: retroviral-like aspartic protease family protein [Myxococcota bacterium]
MRRIIPILTLVALRLTALASEASAAPAEVRFDYRDGLIWIDVRSARHPQALHFILDSGAEQSVLSLRMAKALGLTLHSPEIVSGISSRAIAYRVSPISLTFAEENFRTSPLVIDLSQASRACRRRVDGLLGADFFRNRVIQINYAEQVIRFPDHAPSDPGSIALPIRWNGGAMCVSVGIETVNLPSVRVDTGCTGALHWSPVDTPAPKSASKSIGLSIHRGRRHKTEVFLGTHTIERVRTARFPRAFFSGENGLLGNALLSRFNVTFDAPGSSLILNPQSNR